MYPFLILLASIGVLGLGVYAWRQRMKPAVRTFALLMAAVAIWLSCVGAWSFAATPGIAEFWLQLQFFGVAAVPVLFLSYVLQFTGRGALLTRRRLLLLWLIPLITQVMAWTNPFHHLMFTYVVFAPIGGIMVLKDWMPGAWFLIHSSYSFGILATALLLMIQTIIRSPGIFRRQLLTLLIAVIPPIILTVLTTFRVLPENQLITPLSFVITGAVTVWAVVRYQILSVVPVARELMIEQMDDGMLVLDERRRVVDLNPAMQQMIGRQRGEILSQPIETALAHLPVLLNCIQSMAISADVLLSIAGEQQYFDVRLNQLSQRGNVIGHVLILRNITRLKLIQTELFVLATTDMLTGLHNRRQFFELASPQLDLAIRQQQQTALLLFDIDRFKLINDQYGHAIGDQVLVMVANCARVAMRSTDLICRYGGEEFAALLIDSNLEGALLIAERLRAAIATAEIMVGARTISVTVSIGVEACSPDSPSNLEDLLRRADHAMYQAKQRGRNRVVAYSDQQELDGMI